MTSARRQRPLASSSRASSISSARIANSSSVRCGMRLLHAARQPAELRFGGYDHRGVANLGGAPRDEARRPACGSPSRACGPGRASADAFPRRWSGIRAPAPSTRADWPPFAIRERHIGDFRSPSASRLMLWLSRPLRMALRTAPRSTPFRAAYPFTESVLGVLDAASGGSRHGDARRK